MRPPGLSNAAAASCMFLTTSIGYESARRRRSNAIAVQRGAGVLNPKACGKSVLLRPTGVSEEAVNPVQEAPKPLRVEPRRYIAVGKAVAERVIGSPLGWPPPLGAEDAEIAVIYERQG